MNHEHSVWGPGVAIRWSRCLKSRLRAESKADESALAGRDLVCPWCPGKATRSPAKGLWITCKAETGEVVLAQLRTGPPALAPVSVSLSFLKTALSDVAGNAITQQRFPEPLSPAQGAAIRFESCPQCGIGPGRAGWKPVLPSSWERSLKGGQMGQPESPGRTLVKGFILRPPR